MESHNSKPYKKQIRQDGNDKRVEVGALQNYLNRENTIAALKKKGVNNLFPIQYLTYQTIYEGSDIMARDKTGSGKTLAFALPVIERMRDKDEFKENKLAKFLIVLPTRQLTIQVRDEIESLRFRDQPDFRVVAVYGKADMRVQIESIERGVDIIVATPGRLIDLLERGVIKMNKMQVLCLDEADEMLKQGFKEDIEKIYRYITDNAPKKTQNLLFSATVPDWLQDLSNTYQDRDRKYINLIKEEDLTTPKTLRHLSMKLSGSENYKKAKIITNLLKKYAAKTGNCLIFCQRKRDVESLSLSLSECGVKSEALHGDVPQSRRERAYRQYKAGNLKCLIATNVAARGLDFPQIDVVIQAEPPNNVEPYIHRSGRTARRGRDGICITLYTESTERLIRNIEREARIRMEKLYADDFLGNPLQPTRKRTRHQDEREDEELEVYIKYLPGDKNEQDVKDFFSKKSVKVRSVKIFKTQDGESKGCGFLKFDSRRDRDGCLNCDGDDFDGNHLSLSVPNLR